MQHQPRITGGVVLVRSLRAWLSAVALAVPAAALAAPSFIAQQTLATGTGPRAVAAGDFNGDGKADLAIVNASDANVSVLLNTGATGSTTVAFTTQQKFTVDKNPVAIAVGDLDGDGKPDIVVVNAASGTISVLRNTTATGAATPSFAAQQSIGVGVYPYDVAIGDLDGDGKPDLVVTNVGSGSLSILRNTTAAGATTYAFEAQQKVPVGREPASVSIADFNRDGKPDLAVAAYTDGKVEVLLNTTAAGTTTFSFASTLLSASLGPVSVAVADINGDGLPDIATANIFTSDVSVFLNKTTPGGSTASFAAATATFAVGIGPTSIIAADVDGDGRLDLATSNQGSAAVVLLANTTAPGAATATFAAKQSVTVGASPVAVVAADINGDGRPDLVTTNSTATTASVLLNSTVFGGANADQHGLTGSWFNPATSGQGVELEIYPNLAGAGSGVLFGGWFTYDVTAAGGQRWFALSGSVSNGSPIALLGIYAGQGGNFAASPSVAPTQLGTATINFTSCDHAVLQYEFFDGRSGTVPLNRLTANVTCAQAGDTGAAASNYLLSGSWSQAAIGGQGLIFDVNPLQKGFFAAWYTYAPNGQGAGAASQRWYTIQAAFNPGDKTLTSVPIYATSGGVFDNATAPSAAQVGTATITFASCNAATLAYAFTAGVNSGLSGTLALTRTGPTPAGCTL